MRSSRHRMLMGLRPTTKRDTARGTNASITGRHHPRPRPARQPVSRPAWLRPVLYEEFVRTWTAVLRESGLPVFGVAASEKLDLRSLDRSYEISVEPVGRQDAEPFTVTARLGWRW